MTDVARRSDHTRTGCLWGLDARDSDHGSQSCVIGLTSANPRGAIDIGDKNLAVTDLARSCRPHDRVDDTVDMTGRNRDFDLDLWKKSRGIFGAAVDLCMPLLISEPLDLGYGHASDANL